MTTSRRQDLGLGKTARGGSGGSFASYGRDSGAPPPPPSTFEQTPNFETLLSTDADDWFAIPWAQRKQVIEQASREIISTTPEAQNPPFGTPVRFNKWMSSTRSVAWNKKVTHRFDSSQNENNIELSTQQMRLAEPSTIADTILHEVAHGIDDLRGGHGSGWEQKFRMLLNRHGLAESEVKRVHVKTQAESGAPVHLMRRYRGVCPNDPSHISYRDGKPRTHVYCCTRGECRTVPHDQRILEYEKNPEFQG